MAGREPTAELDERYGDADTPTSWADALRRFEQAQVYWVVTVRTEGGPHLTPLFGVELDGALYFFTGPTEQKARNLAANPRCALLTGCSTIDGLDVVVEGEAARVRDGAFAGPGGNEAHLFELVPSRGYGFGKGKAFSHTRFRF